MGLTFRKSISLPGGFRINLSKSGVGASWGVSGLRVSTGPQGSRLHAYVPGTGVGYTTGLGSIGAKVSGEERSARRAQRDLEAREPGVARMEERERAAHAVASFENRIAVLTTLHKEPPGTWDWRTIAAAPPPAKPGAIAQWQWWNNLAAGVLRGDPAAYDAALAYLSPFRELAQLGLTVEAAADGSGVVEARLHVQGREIIPSDALRLTKTGKVSTKKLSASKVWTLYQDHVASAVLHAGREILALLPVELALVHARARLLDSATGREEEHCIMSAAMSREAMAAIDFTRIDPSDALDRFPHLADFSPRSGYAPVEEMRVEDLLEAAGSS